MFTPPKTSYAIIEKEDQVSLMQGTICDLNCFDELKNLHKKKKDIVFMNPYNTIKTKKYEALGDEVIKALIIEKKSVFKREEFLETLPSKQDSIAITEVTPHIDDKEFSKIIHEVQEKEIKGGNISQVTLSRIYHTKLQTMSEDIVLEIFRRLLGLRGQYMTFLFVDKSKEFPHYFCGISPEKHLQITDKSTTMIPIAGTLKKGNQKDLPERLKNFIQDKKEINELFQILDEEMKMMATICPQGGAVKGPFLRDTGAVIHTEYQLLGHKSHLSPLEALEKTLHAPTVTGSPMESACRIIKQYEKISRRYYGGEIGILEGENLDSGIFLRSAEIDYQGNIRVQAGGGIVRDSVPEKEVEESQTKASSFINILTKNNLKNNDNYLNASILDSLQPLLSERSKDLSSFHYSDQSHLKMNPKLKNLKILLIDNEDHFIDVLSHMLRHMGIQTSIIDSFDFDIKDQNFDLFLIGPGPGDINDQSSLRMKTLRRITKELLGSEKNILGICLGHQAISNELGIPVKKQAFCTQGLAEEYFIFNAKQKLGFYNSFAPHTSKLPNHLQGDIDERGRLLSLAGNHHLSFQFHLESILTTNGYSLLQESVLSLLEKRIPNFAKL